MASAQNGAMTFQGRSGRIYNIDYSTADSGAGVLGTFNPSGAAVSTSPTYWRAPEAVVLKDFAMHTGTTQTGLVMTEDGAIKNGTVLKYPQFLDSLANRPVLNIPFNAGALIGAQSL